MKPRRRDATRRAGTWGGGPGGGGESTHGVEHFGSACFGATVAMKVVAVTHTARPWKLSGFRVASPHNERVFDGVSCPRLIFGLVSDGSDSYFA